MTPYLNPVPAQDNLRYSLRRFVVGLSDASMVLLAYFLAFACRFFYPPLLKSFPVVKGYPPFHDYLVAAPLLVFGWIIAVSWQDGYKHLRLPAVDEGIRLARASIIGTLLSMSAMFLYRESSFSRLVFLLTGVFGFLFIYISRQVLKVGYIYWVSKSRRPRRVLIIGNGYLSTALQRILKSYGDRAVLKHKSQDVASIQRTIVRSRIHEVLVANPHVDHKNAITLANFCESAGVRYRLLPDILEIRMGEVVVDESLGVPTFQLRPISLHGTSFMMKRFVDVTITSLVAGILFVPLSLIALLIKLTSHGDIFYRQERLGYHQQPFDFLKFRTMVHNAEELLQDLKKHSDRAGPVFKMKNDPRITFIGKILRKFSIDEIPQIWNVLKGEMSIVGPRPQVLWETAAYDEWAKKRLNVLPGITGLWQISGRAELTYQEMIELDIYYIENWSSGLDLKILLKTFPAVLFGKGAY